MNSGRRETTKKKKTTTKIDYVNISNFEPIIHKDTKNVPLLYSKPLPLKDTIPKMGGVLDKFWVKDCKRIRQLREITKKMKECHNNKVGQRVINSMGKNKYSVPAYKQNKLVSDYGQRGLK